MTVSERASRYLAAMDHAVANQGGHDQTFKAAVTLVNGFALDGETARVLLSEWNQTHCQPSWSPREIDHKINSALAHPGTKPRGYLRDGEGSAGKGSAASIPVRPSAPKWPDFEEDRIIALLDSQPVTVADMKRSGIVDVSKPIAPVEIIDTIFGNGPDPAPFLCLSKDPFTAVTKRRSEWTADEIDGQVFVVPNLMRSAFGLIKEGAATRESARCKNNVSESRRFIVVEADLTPESAPEVSRLANEKGMDWFDVGASIAGELAQYAPLVLCCSSAGKSVHSWFAVQDRTENEIRNFMKFACLYGGDFHTFSPVSLVRLPNGIRPGKGRQELLFLDNNQEPLAWY